MKILALDTATRTCSVAVVDGERLAAEMTIEPARTHSRHLMEMIDTVLRTSGLTIAGLDGLAVTRGPGSFTGLRIGISTIKGLAAASGKPLVGVSALEVLAARFPFTPYLICPAIDARKKQVYTARYRMCGKILKPETPETVLSPEAAFSGISEPCILAGDGVLLYRQMIGEKTDLSAWIAPPGFHVIRAADIARMAADRLAANTADDPGTFAPNYIRQSDAELGFGSPQLPD